MLGDPIQAVLAVLAVLCLISCAGAAAVYGPPVFDRWRVRRFARSVHRDLERLPVTPEDEEERAWA